MLREALVACAGVTLNVVATELGYEIGNAEVRAEGDLDFAARSALPRTHRSASATSGWPSISAAI